MKMAMKIAALFTFLIVGAASPAWAQFNQWGTGMWGANQACNSPYRVASGSTNELDGVREAQNQISKAERELRKKKSELKKMERELERARSDVENSISSDFSDFVFEHIENGRSCGAYSGSQGDPGACGEGDAGCVAHESGVAVRAYSQSEWSRACAASYSGVVNNQYVCSLQRSRNSDGRGATVSDCQKALGIYTKGYKKKMTTEREIDRLERMIENWKDDIQTAKEDYIDSLRDRQTSTEGGICWDCVMGSGSVQAERQTDWANVLANGVVGGLAMYMGYQTNKMVSQNNAALGWPTQAYPAWGYGLPFIQNAIYGALGGGIGQGGFGCAGGMNGGGYGMGPMGMMGPNGNGSLYGYPGMNGMYGFPNGMMGNPMGGGMYMPGMGPWGMNGPYGGMGMPYPGAYGMPAMGMPMSMGMMAGGGMGMPGMGMQMPGMGMMGMGMPGMGMQMPGMGMMAGMGMPGMGMQMPGMGMMGMGMPGMGMQMPGMGMAGMGMPGMGMQMPGMGMMGIMGMGGYDMSAQMQMQQQVMQMQMQQYQAAMQQQMQAQQSYMQRQQIVSGLQQEMYQLMYRIQQVQMGGIGGGMGVGIGVGGTIGIGGATGTGGGYLGNTYYPTTTTPTPVQGTIGR